jgi:branched-chain amino acid transport system permease protein
MIGKRNLWANKLTLDLKFFLLLCGFIALVPLLDLTPYTLGILIISFYFALIAIGWNLLAGFTGQFSMAPAAFAMIGGYTAALLNYHFGLSLWIGIPSAVAVSALLGFLVGSTVLGLKGPYLSLTTLAFAEVTRVIISNSHAYTRGDQGINVPTLMQSRIGYYYLFLAVLIATALFVYSLMRSRYGGFLLAIRDDAHGAQSRGIPVVKFKLIAFILSSAISGFAGCLYGTFTELVSPEMGLVQQAGIIISMVVIGGMGSLCGPLMGALIVYLGSEWLRSVGNIQMIVFALTVIIFARFFRTGLWGLFVKLYFYILTDKKH